MPLLEYGVVVMLMKEPQATILPQGWRSVVAVARDGGASCAIVVLNIPGVKLCSDAEAGASLSSFESPSSARTLNLEDKWQAWVTGTVASQCVRAFLESLTQNDGAVSLSDENLYDLLVSSKPVQRAIGLGVGRKGKPGKTARCLWYSC